MSRDVTLHYWRIAWADTDANLEELVRRAYGRLPTTDQRTFPYRDKVLVGISKRDTTQSRGFFFRTAVCEPDQATSVVEKPSAAPEAQTNELAPPPQRDFVMGDCFGGIFGNHLILGTVHCRNSAATTYLQNLLASSLRGNEVLPAFEWVSVANSQVVQTIAREGVHRIRLKDSLYEATLDHTIRTEVRRTFRQMLSNTFESLFADDDALREVADRENLQVEVVLSYDKRISVEGEVSQRRLAQLGNRAANDPGITIVTNAGTVIESGDVSAQKKISVSKVGNSVHDTEMWTEIGMFFQELQRSGQVNQ